MCDIVGIHFTSVIWNAPVPTTLEQLKALNESNSGAIVIKTQTLKPRQGNPLAYTLHDTYSQNKIALHNDGIEKCIRELLLLDIRKPVFISLYGTEKELVQMIKVLNVTIFTFPLLLEWNISCPNAPEAEYTLEMFQHLKQLSNYSLGVKISFDSLELPYTIFNYDQERTKLAHREHILREADFITAINTINGSGGRSIHQTAVETVRKLSRMTSAPIIGVGGVDSISDVHALMDAGAIAVEIGTAYIRHGPKIFNNIYDSLIDELYRHGIIKHGEFKSSAGETLDTYVDFRIVPSLPRLWTKLLDRVLRELKDVTVDLICGVPIGGIPLATVVALYLRKPLLIVRKSVKRHGSKKQIEGLYKSGQTCLLIEDVITTGQSIIKAKSILVEAGLQVRSFCLLDRSNTPGRFGKFLYTLSDLKPPYYRPKYRKNLRLEKLQNVIRQKKTKLCLAADLESEDDLIDIIQKVGPHICMVKIHWDIMLHKDPHFINRLSAVCKEQNVLVWVDRKLLDIGNTAKSQYEMLAYNIEFDFISVHMCAGTSILDIFDDPQVGVFIVTDFSSNKADPLYIQRVLSVKHHPLVCGIIAQECLDDDLLHIVPGVSLSKTSDSLGQHYRKPQDVTDFADVVVVGRYIYQSINPAKMAKNIVSKL